MRTTPDGVKATGSSDERAQNSLASPEMSHEATDYMLLPEGDWRRRAAWHGDQMGGGSATLLAVGEKEGREARNHAVYQAGGPMMGPRLLVKI